MKKKKNLNYDLLNYIRLNTDTTLPMDKYDTETISALIAVGDKLYNDNIKDVKVMMEQIIDEKFGYLLKKWWLMDGSQDRSYEEEEGITEHRSAPYFNFEF